MNTIVDASASTADERRERPAAPVIVLPLTPVRAAKECNHPKSCTYPLCEC